MRASLVVFGSPGIIANVPVSETAKFAASVNPLFERRRPSTIGTAPPRTARAVRIERDGEQRRPLCIDEMAAGDVARCGAAVPHDRPVAPADRLHDKLSGVDLGLCPLSPAARVKRTVLPSGSNCGL